MGNAIESVGFRFHQWSCNGWECRARAGFGLDGAAHQEARNGHYGRTVPACASKICAKVGAEFWTCAFSVVHSNRGITACNPGGYHLPWRSGKNNADRPSRCRCHRPRMTDIVSRWMDRAACSSQAGRKWPRWSPTAPIDRCPRAPGCGTGCDPGRRGSWRVPKWRGW